MFRKLCGDKALKNVVIVTNRWGEVDHQVGEAREAELMGDDTFFKPVLAQGAQKARHYDTVSSAENIIRLTLKNEPLPLRIQEELCKEGKDISATAAGEELDQEFSARIKKHEQEMQELMEDLQQAAKDQDEETRRELETERQKMQEQIEKFRGDSKRLKPDYEKEKKRLEARMQKAQSEAKREAELAEARYQEQIRSFTNRRSTRSAASASTNARGSENDDWIMIPIHE